ncbi:MAG TPA: phosphate propanoyltransferase [Candidatus Baltobacteraceae bacterium]|nr:phosphate propanoyltransferase [Candidatus Baltobacteraceae bacterium]
MTNSHPAAGKPVRIEYSARHVHLSQEHQDILFGPGYEMKKLKELSQTGQFAYEEKVIVKGSKGQAEARVLGPCRKQTQVELAFSDGFKLGVETPVRISGDLAGSGKCELVGPKGSVELSEGVINDQRHLHISDKEAEGLGLKNGDVIAVRVPGETPITVHDVAVRVHPSFRMNIHLDTDEANAASLKEQGASGTIVEVIPPKS